MAFLRQRSGDGRQMSRLGRIAHDAGGRLGRIATQDGNQSTVRAEAVGIKTSEEDAFLCDGIQLYCHVLLGAYGRQEVAGEALHDDDENVGRAICSLRG